MATSQRFPVAFVTSRYGRDVFSIYTGCAVGAYPAAHYLPPTLAVLTVVGMLTACLTAPFLAPVDPPTDAEERP